MGAHWLDDCQTNSAALAVLLPNFENAWVDRNGAEKKNLRVSCTQRRQILDVNPIAIHDQQSRFADLHL
jgi:hypothetical protein